MKLFNALIATSIIVLVFWSVAVFQPRIAVASTSQVAVSKQVNVQQAASAQEQAQPTKPQKIAKPQKTKFQHEKETNSVTIPVNDIVGVTRNIHLDGVSELWMDFHQKSSLHDGLTDYPDKVYVYYRDFSNDYQSAKVTIGYSTQLLPKVKPLVKLKVKLPKSTFKVLLKKQSYSNTELANVWQQIDYRQNPQGVIEIHHLNKKGETVSSEMLITQ